MSPKVSDQIFNLTHNTRSRNS